ncbi:translation initiation factor IF-2-like [Cervus elaphus]|uniref:translation initiation factor IF-2-like n=1 Tax=Cervus elaphus TaxID=9860 RepID=UPI001CC31AE9|nr:translation initiation factor IF-2-like [Cervus elaphus]
MGGVAASVWFTSAALPRAQPRPLTTRRPHPSASLRPTSCLRPSGPGRTSFAKLGRPGPWQEVPSRLPLACCPRWPLEASLSSPTPGLPGAGPLPPAPCLGADIPPSPRGWKDEGRPRTRPSPGGGKASRSHHPGGKDAAPSLGTLSSSPTLSQSPRALGRVNTEPCLPPARPSSGSCSISCSPCKHSRPPDLHPEGPVTAESPALPTLRPQPAFHTHTHTHTSSTEFNATTWIVVPGTVPGPGGMP